MTWRRSPRSTTASSTSCAQIVGDDSVSDRTSARASTAPACRRRSRSTAGRSTSRRSVVLPTTAEQVSEIVKLANRAADPGRAARRRHRPRRRRRAAAPRHPRRHQADGPDPRDRPRRPHRHGRARHQHAEAQRAAAPARRHLSRRPGVVPVLARRRADRHQRLVAARRAVRSHARSRDLVRDRAADRRDHPGRRRRRHEGPQVLDRLSAQAAVHGRTRERSASSPRRRSSWSSGPRPSSRRSSPTTTT